MFRRAIFMFCFMMFSLSALIFALYKISTKEKLYEVANNKNFYRLKIANSRGTIYDCRGIPLLGKRKKLLAAVTPNQENFIKILNLIQEDSREIFIKKFQNNLPFVIELKEKIECNGIQIFEIPVRYSDSTLAQHVIGYLSDEGVGLCGIEKSFEEHLGNKSDIEVIYQRNAAGKLMTGQNYSFNDKSYLNVSGVKLCIDERIQSIVEETANKHIKKGAIIVSEVPNCKIRASVSFPGYLPESIELFLNSEDSNLMNRAICQYNLGSIFKLVTAAVILENGYNENIFYSCKGVYEFPDRTKTSCFNKVPHGYINLERAISLSCNTLFANFSKNIDPEFFIKISKELGFGNSIKLAPNIVSCKGNLPTIEELSNEKKMAMFSFGQASLMVTPIQV
ncbi:MAG: penicillin-binding transpeptidase domain-containing protein, partial [Firmicutes bacterium]|nr:penicillin-binding transpeptidase domain-containing protein [Bacillota bacterium]